MCAFVGMRLGGLIYVVLHDLEGPHALERGGEGRQPAPGGSRGRTPACGSSHWQLCALQPLWGIAAQGHMLHIVHIAAQGHMPQIVAPTHADGM